MGPCRPEDQNWSSSTRRITAAEEGGGEPRQEQQAVNDNTVEQQNVPTPELVDPLQAQQEAWAAAEGYTPLADLTGSGDGTFLMSMGPGGDSDSEDENANGMLSANGGAAFFVNPSAFGAATIDDDDDKEEEQDVNEYQQISSAAATTTTPAFEDAAARALLALDEEYQHCLQPGGVVDSVADAEPKIDNTNDSNNKPDNEDEDMKIIAAAFDRRKEEMQQIQKQGGFPVDWGSTLKPKKHNPTETKMNHDVDTDAIKKAVQALSVKNKDAKFQQKFEAWQQKQKGNNKKKTENIPKHALIPASSMKAFYRSTPKAKQATANLTRSATLAEALVRIIIARQRKFAD
ncbi:MAG: hypothetical protein SGARI_003327 [Bacillariaceae sp.]